MQMALANHASVALIRLEQQMLRMTDESCPSSSACFGAAVSWFGVCAESNLARCWLCAIPAMISGMSMAMEATHETKCRRCRGCHSIPWQYLAFSRLGIY